MKEDQVCLPITGRRAPVWKGRKVGLSAEPRFRQLGARYLCLLTSCPLQSALSRVAVTVGACFHPESLRAHLWSGV